MEKLSEIIASECVIVPLSSTDRWNAIEELVTVLHHAGRISDPQPLLDAVIAREKTRSTGIGQGLAIPHGKCKGLKGVIGAAGKPRKPIDFESVDGRPVDFIVLFGSEVDKTGSHIQALAKLSRLMTLDGFRRDIAQSADAKSVYDTFLKHER